MEIYDVAVGYSLSHYCKCICVMLLLIIRCTGMFYVCYVDVWLCVFVVGMCWQVTTIYTTRTSALVTVSKGNSVIYWMQSAFSSRDESRLHFATRTFTLQITNVLLLQTLCRIYRWIFVTYINCNLPNLIVIRKADI